jgi:hypothetical protein
MCVFDERLHCARSIVAKNALDLDKEPPCGYVRPEEPSGDGKYDEKSWREGKCGKEADAGAHRGASVIREFADGGPRGGHQG